MKALAFDLGNVVFGFDYRIALEKIKDKIQIPAEEILEKLYSNNFGLSFEKGLISGEQFYQEFKEQFGLNASYTEFVDIWCNIFYPQNDVIDLVAKLSSRYPVYLISNINKLHFDFLYSGYPAVFALFNDLILSFKLKSVKPERKIYRALQTLAGTPSENIIYIDDRQDLIQIAESFNFHCLRFTDCPSLIRDLKFLGIVCD